MTLTQGRAQCEKPYSNSDGILCILNYLKMYVFSLDYREEFQSARLSSAGSTCQKTGWEIRLNWGGVPEVPEGIFLKSLMDCCIL